MIFGGISALLLVLFQLRKWSLFASRGPENIAPVLIGLAFLMAGALFSKYILPDIRKQRLKSSSNTLSKQEFRVLQLVADGCSNKEIADQLFISETTVKSHVSSILSKLNARRRTEAVRIARELNLL